MSCPTCKHTMHNVGLESERTFWCPRCGTLKTYTGAFENVSSPALAARIRAAEEVTVRTSVDGRTIQYAVPSVFWVDVCESVGIEAHGRPAHGRPGREEKT